MDDAGTKPPDHLATHGETIEMDKYCSTIGKRKNEFDFGGELSL